jgi:DNA invertase Pin-like site-specific DNA recombinase
VSLPAVRAAERRAVGYCRVSTDEQARQGLSLEDQEAKIRSYCNLVDLQLVEVVVDPGVGGSRTLASRPGGQAVLAHLRGGASDVVAIKLDRLFRNAADCLATVEIWDRSGKNLHLVDFGGQTINTATAAGRLFITMLAGFAAFERDLISERTTSALAFRRENVRPFSRDPYGWAAEDGQLVAVDDEQVVLRLVRERREEGRTLRAIAGELNDQAIPPKRGAAWHASWVRSILAGRVGVAQEAPGMR